MAGRRSGVGQSRVRIPIRSVGLRSFRAPFQEYLQA